jgi:uncharacterized protein YjlB
MPARKAPKKAQKPLTFLFKDDGTIPNNPRLPFVVYRGAIDVREAPLGEEVIERVFDTNGWGDMWRNGVYPYAHYHSKIHEAMGVARGRAKVRFGGKTGRELELEAGDVAILPAGTGHQCLKASRDFVVVGAYPPDGEYDLCRARKAARKNALETIPKVPLPKKDPAFGTKGPLKRLWRG